MTDRYPLSWPTGWKRTPAGQRQRAKFRRQETVYSSHPDGGSWKRTADLTVAGVGFAGSSAGQCRRSCICRDL